MVKGMQAYDDKKRRQIRRRNREQLDARIKPVIKHRKPQVPDNWNKQNWRINDEDGID